MRGTVEEINTSAAGKPRVKVNGQWYSIKGIMGMDVGHQIDFDASSWDYKGKTYHGIDKWGLIPGTGSAAAMAGNGHQIPVTPMVTPAPAPIAAMTGDELRFISNVVGSAITSGTIKDPVDLIAWARGAQAALQHLADARVKF